MFAPFATSALPLSQESLFTSVQRKRKLEDAELLETLEFPFSNLMRTMAARYHIRSHVLSVLHPNLGPRNPCKKMKVEEPLDLSSCRLSTDAPSLDPLDDRFRDMEGWGVDRVVEFVGEMEECKDYAEIFRKEEIDGSCLIKLSLHHLTTFLGIKIGPAVKLLMQIHDRRAAAAAAIKNEI